MLLAAKQQLEGPLPLRGQIIALARSVREQALSLIRIENIFPAPLNIGNSFMTQ